MGLMQADTGSMGLMQANTGSMGLLQATTGSMGLLQANTGRHFASRYKNSPIFEHTAATAMAPRR